MVLIHVPTPALSGSGNMGLISALNIEAPLNEILAKLFKIIIQETLNDYLFFLFFDKIYSSIKYLL